MTPTLKIYKASAGSGKTFTLAVQYILLLLTHDAQEFKHTLAVTFTNKATAEMKDRILEQLYGLAHNLPSSQGYMQKVLEELNAMNRPMSREQVSARCLEALTGILHDYSRFAVQTIDSFFQNVLRNLAHELNLTARLQVDLNDTDVLEKAVDNIIDSLQCDDRVLLPWIQRFINESIETDNKWDVRANVKRFARCIFQESYMTRTEEEIQRMSDAEKITEFARTMRQLIDKEQKKVQQQTDALMQIMQDSGCPFDDAISYFNQYLNLCKRVKEGNLKEGLNATLQKHMADPSAVLKAKYKKDAAAQAMAEKISAQLAVIDQAINDAYFLINSAQLSLKYLNPLRLLQNIDHEVNRITNDSNQFILAKTPILLSNMVQGTDASFIFEKMGTQLNNVMIDEFQDTSNLQWKNFCQLLLENQATGGTDLIVGDVKQSIYRWRSGDWRILHGIKDAMANMNPQELTLETNYRSDRRVIEFNNQFFEKAASLVDEKSGNPEIIKALYADVSQLCPSSKGEAGYIQATIYKKQDKKKTTEGEKTDWQATMLDDMCTQIERLHHEQDVPYNQMALVVRTRKQVPQMIEYFATHLPSVKLISDEAFILSGSVSVNMIIAAMKYILMGNSDPVSLRYLMLHYLADVRHEQNTVDDFCLSNPADVLPAEYTQRMREFSMMPLYELSEELYRIFQLHEVEKQEAYIFSFLDELSAYLRDNPSDLVSFLHYWDNTMCNRPIPSGEVDGIRIFTIHKSKGLQFHTVLMPYAHWTMEKDKNDDIMWCLPQDEPFNQLGLLPVSPSTSMEESTYGNEYRYEHLQRRIDELNTLYVAFTRAEKNLLIWARDEEHEVCTPLGDIGNLIHSTLQQMDGLQLEDTDATSVYTLGEPAPYRRKVEKSSDNRLSPDYESNTVQMVSYRARLDFRQSNESEQFVLTAADEPTPTAEGESLSYIEQGKLLHEIFSNIHEASQADDVLRSYWSQGLISTHHDCERMAAIIHRALQHPQAQQWFDGQSQIYNECEIISRDPESGQYLSRRPDRVMMTDTDVTIVDFKFGRRHAEYADQVREYMQLIHNMYPQHRVQGWIWYVYSNETEEVSL